MKDLQNLKSVISERIQNFHSIMLFAKRIGDNRSVEIYQSKIDLLLSILDEAKDVERNNVTSPNIEYIQISPN